MSAQTYNVQFVATRTIRHTVTVKADSREAAVARARAVAEATPECEWGEQRDTGKPPHGIAADSVTDIVDGRPGRTTHCF